MLWIRSSYRTFVPEVTNIFMKRIFGLALSLVLFCTSHAQTITANDSVITGPGYNQLIFYNITTGTKTISSNTDWHLAVSVRPTQYPQHPLGGTTIRCNEANGVNVYVAPNANAASFTNLDTTNWRSWTKLHDSDTALDMGALNSNRSSTNIFDFGWGKYNGTTHNVVGDSIYLIELPNGEIKKFLVVALVFDTAFDIQYANIDNSSLQNVHIGKAAYQGKEFVYLNLSDNIVHDKEPLATDWNLQFLQYMASDAVQGTYQAKTGVLINGGTTVAPAASIGVNSNDFQTYTFGSRLNIIGWNWQTYDSTTATYGVKDSLAYFVLPDSNHYKIVFTGFGGPTTGVISFYAASTSVIPSGITEATNDMSLTTFPNPASSSLNILLNGASSATIKVFDISGKIVATKETSDQLTQLNTSAFADGVYLLSVTNKGNTYFSKFVKAN
ncbi:MAG: hypothetical protein JWO06_396 [Bacteroidota bacterium]|nr:hypothetical protein [Bacteroidota bacterium]